MRGTTKTVFSGDIVWADGSVSKFPPIVRAHSGWWYKPDEAITNHNKTFGMGDKGHDLALRWHTDLFVEEQLKRDRVGQHPIKITNPLPVGPIGGSENISVAYVHPVYGQIRIDLEVYGTGYSYRRPSLRYDIRAHRLIERFNPNKENHVRDPWAQEQIVYSKGYEAKAEDVEGFMVEFQKDPWRTACNKINMPVELQVALDPPSRLLEGPPLEFSSEEQDFDGIRTFLAAKLKQHIGHEVRKTIASNLKSMEELGTALRYFGVSFNVHTSWGTDGKVITGLTVQIPKSEQRGNEEGHLFKITAEGVLVTCGYVENEQRYHRYEIEKAKKTLQGFNEEVFEAFEF